LVNTGWVTTATSTGTIGVTAMPWTQFSGAGTYSAGTGLSLIGTTFSIANTGVTAASYGSASQTLTATVNAQGQLTALAANNIAIAANQITSGTINTASISGAYTGITGLGTLLDLTVTNTITGSINGDAATATTAWKRHNVHHSHQFGWWCIGFGSRSNGRWRYRILGDWIKWPGVDLGWRCSDLGNADRWHGDFSWRHGYGVGHYIVRHGDQQRQFDFGRVSGLDRTPRIGGTTANTVRGTTIHGNDKSLLGHFLMRQTVLAVLCA